VVVVVVYGTIGGILRKTIFGIVDFRPSLSWALMPKNTSRGTPGNLFIN